MSDKPVVVATLLTGKCPERIKMAKIAVECFFAQDYSHRELLIVNHGEESLGFPDAREYMVTRDVYRTLGDLRNYAMECAQPNLVVTWDDDDWYAPNYISEMVDRWKPGHLVNYKFQTRHDVQSNSSYVCGLNGGHHGQVLYDSRCGYRYQQLNVAEDTKFMWCFGKSRITFDNDALFYCRLAHPWNTWGRKHIMKGHEKSKNYHHKMGAKQKEFIAKIRKVYGLPAKV